MNETPQSELLTLGEVALRLRVSQRWVCCLVDRGELPAVRIGPHCRRVTEADLAAYLSQKRTVAVDKCAA